jgi:hypothetical protein
MPTYFFDIKDGHRLVDPKGQNLKDDAAAIAKAKVVAIGVSLDKPVVDPTRCNGVIDGVGQETQCLVPRERPADLFFRSKYVAIATRIASASDLNPSEKMVRSSTSKGTFAKRRRRS